MQEHISSLLTVFTSRAVRAQVRVLSSRFLRSWGRSPVHLVVQAAQYIIAALLLGAYLWLLQGTTCVHHC